MERGCSSFSFNATRMMMLKMCAGALLLLLCCFVANTHPVCDLHAAEGQNFNVPLDFKLDAAHRLRWLTGSKTVFYQIKDKVIVGDKKLINADGSFKLTNVNKNNAGNYTFQVYSAEGLILKDSSKYLCVVEAAPKPTLKFACVNDAVKFICVVNNKVKGLTFEWIRNNEAMKRPSQTLDFKVADTVKDSFRCNVSNVASSATSDAVTHTCTLPSSSVFPDVLFGFDFWVMVGILAGGGGLVLLLIIIVIVCCIRARRKKSMKLKDEEELRLGWTNEHEPHHQEANRPSLYLHPTHQHPPQHHHHHHHHQQQHQPAGPHQPRSKQRPRAPPTPGGGGGGRPHPSPRRPAAQLPSPVANEEEHPPPLPQPRKKAPRAQRV